MNRRSLKIKILAFIMTSSLIALPVKAQNLTSYNSNLKYDVASKDVGGTSIPVTISTNTSDEIKNIIKNYYLYDVNDELLKGDDPNEIVEKLNDPYSVYFTKEEYQDFVNNINRSFVGIGVYIEKVDDGIKITGFTEQSSAKESGLQIGDIILKADDVTLKNLPADKAAEYIKGEEGTYVNLVVKRGDIELNFSVERKTINMKNVIYKVLDGNIGYIKITTFSKNSPQILGEAIKYLKDKNVDSYIIDLMDNPGGYLSSGVNTAGYFIGNEPVVKLTDKHGKSIEYRAPSYDELIDKPTVFLINKNSASASEILSAAVKDYKKAVFIGQNTFGKGVAQSLFTLNDGSVLKLTTEKFVSPLGNEINKVGVKPDIEYNGDNLGCIKTAEIYLSKDKPQVSVYKGKDRYETCAMISKLGWKISDYAVLVTGEDYADALSSVTLAKMYNAPILITKTNELTPQTEEEIKRLKVKNIFIVGGEAAVSNSIFQKLTSQGINCVRLSGSDRYETSVKVADYIAKQCRIKTIAINDQDNTSIDITKQNKAVIVSGNSFADAMSSASYAASNNIPILLTKNNGIPASTYRYLKDNDITKTYVVGGSGVVSDKVLNELPNAERISGQDRYSTNMEVLSKFSKDFNVKNVYFVKGSDYPDALTAAALAARTKAPIILTKDTNTYDLLKYVKNNLNNIENAYMLGGSEIKGL